MTNALLYLCVLRPRGIMSFDSACHAFTSSLLKTRDMRPFY